MYYEEAIVKEYVRDKGKPSEKTFKQIYLGTSKYNKKEPVVILASEDFNKIKDTNPEEIAELEATIKKLSEENVQLKNDLQEAKKEHENIIEETTNILNETKDKVEEVRSEKEAIINDKDSTIKVKDSLITELNVKLNNEKDYSKALLVARSDLISRNIIDRITNKEPESSKIVAKLRPKEIEAKPSEE